ncbi:MAG TPA: hypothetical protein PK765_01590 [bacterium]|nr:hypothetical protein [bacterium]
MLGFFKIYFLGIEKIEVPMPPDEMKPLVILAVVSGKPAKFHVKLHRRLNNDEHEDVEFARLVDKVQESLVLAGEVGRKIARIEIDTCLVQDDIKLETLLHYPVEAEPFEVRGKAAEVGEGPRKVGGFGFEPKVSRVLPNDHGEKGADIAVKKLRKTGDIRAYVLLLVGIDTPNRSKKVDILVVVVNIVEIGDEIKVT